MPRGKASQIHIRLSVIFVTLEIVLSESRIWQAFSSKFYNSRKTRNKALGV